MSQAECASTDWREAPAHPALETGEVHLWRARLDIPDALLERLRGILSNDECRRVDRLVFPEHRRRGLIWRAAARMILARYAEAGPEELTFDIAPGGKPSLAERFGGRRVRFNLSHSEDLMLMAVTAGRELGVDVEKARSTVAHERLARRYFRKDEVADLLSLPESQREAAFFRCWTRKEAYMKATGKGLAIPLSSFRVPVLPDAPMKIIVASDPAAETRWMLLNLEPCAGFAGALVVDGPVTRLCHYEWKP